MAKYITNSTSIEVSENGDNISFDIVPTSIIASILTGDENNKAPSVAAVNDALVDTYSTNEVKTNKVWIDGKPIYRKYIPLPDHPTTTSPFLKTLDLSNIEKIWLDTIHSQWVSTSSGNSFQFPYYDGSGYVGFYFTISNGAPTLNVRHNQNIYWIYLVVEYTKTTD